MKVKFPTHILSLLALFLPHIAHANVVWPALYFAAGLWHFWFIVIATIIIETFAIQLFLKVSGMKALLVSIIGNIMSGAVGTVLSAIGMLGWHYLFDRFLNGTFDTINTIATVIIMLSLSIILELLTVSFIWKFPIRKLLIPLSIGNLLSYAFIIINIDVLRNLV